MRSYFADSSSLTLKGRHLAARIAQYEYVVTDSEGEALILENTLIKRYKPKYNVRLKDDKTYPYIKIDLEEEFPRVYFTRRREDERGARYFGPFASARLGAANPGPYQEAVSLQVLHEEHHGHRRPAMPGLLHTPVCRAVHRGGVSGGVPPGNRPSDHVPGGEARDHSQGPQRPHERGRRGFAVRKGRGAQRPGESDRKGVADPEGTLATPQGRGLHSAVSGAGRGVGGDLLREGGKDGGSGPLHHGRDAGRGRCPDHGRFHQAVLRLRVIRAAAPAGPAHA